MLTVKGNGKGDNDDLRRNKPKPVSQGRWSFGASALAILLAFAAMANIGVYGDPQSKSSDETQCLLEQPKLTLYYFNTKSRGEAIRLYCAYAGLELNDITLGGDSFRGLKKNSKLDFSKVPMLEINDGEHYLVQTSAILRYLATLAKKHPSDPIAAAKVDASLDQVHDTFLKLQSVMYSEMFGLTPISENEDLWDEAMENMNENMVPKDLQKVEDHIQKSTSGWMADTTEPSAADFYWYVFLNYHIKGNKWLDESLRQLEAYPGLRNLLEKLSELEAIQAFYRERAASGKTPISGQPRKF